MSLDQANSEERIDERAIIALVVEDDPENRFIVEREIANAGGFKSVSSSNVEDALKILDSQVVDLIFCDLRLPKKPTDKVRDVRGGLEIAAKGKDRSKYFILSTANAQAFAGLTKDQLKDLGINSVIDKYLPSLKIIQDRLGEAKRVIRDAEWQIPQK